mgnify:CR=1 FL=1
MSYNSITTKAAIQAQSVLAQMQGMTRGGTNFTNNGAAFVGVFGHPRLVEEMNPGGGYKRRVEVGLIMTRDQIDTPPASKGTVTRTDIEPHITYRIDTVDDNDPLVWVMVLVKIGE